MKYYSIIFISCFFFIHTEIVLTQSGRSDPPNESFPGPSLKGMNDKPQGAYPIPSSNLVWDRQQNVRDFLIKNPQALKSKRAFHPDTGWGFSIGSQKNWYADDLTSSSSRYKVPSTCRAVDRHCYIFVEDASWNSGRVNQSILDSLRIAFDTRTPSNKNYGIFTMVSDVFGDPPDVDNDSRIIILLLDIRDGFSGSGGYVVGYFNSFNEIDTLQPGFGTSNFAEMFFLDTYPLNLLTPAGLRLGSSTMAHEFQHMIHFNYNNGHSLFINEGCSLVSEVLCGYPIFNQSYFVSETDHYLFDWRMGNLYYSLRDYSRAARFFTYLRDQFGPVIFRHLVSSPYDGEACINDALSKNGNSLRFIDIFQNWCIANVIDDRTINPSYGYIYPNLPKVKATTYYTPNVSSLTQTIDRYSAQYMSFNNGFELRALFSSTSTGLIVKAIEIGGSGKNILSVSPNTEFYEPLFGTEYTEILFIVINLSSYNLAYYTYATSGRGGFEYSIVDTFDIPIRAPSGICFDGQSFLIPNYSVMGGLQSIYKIESRSYQVTEYLPAPSLWTSGIAWDGFNIWVMDGYPLHQYSLIRLSQTGVIQNYFPAVYSCYPAGIAWDGSKLYYGTNVCWASPPGAQSMIYKANPSNGAILDSLSPPSGNITGLVFFDGFLYYCDDNAQSIFKIDLKGKIIWAFPSPGPWPTGLTMAKGYLWNIDWYTNKVYQIDIGIAPKIPKDFCAVGGDAMVQLTWTPNVDPDFLQYKIYRAITDNSLLATCIDSIRLIGMSSYLDRNVTNLQRYFYWASAADSSGYESKLTQSVSVIPIDRNPPPPPSSIVGRGDSGVVYLEWSSDFVPDLSNFRIYRSASRDSFEAIFLDSVFWPTVNYTDSKFPNAGIYSYWINSVDRAGNESYLSASVSVDPRLPTQFLLFQNYPNPFNLRTIVQYTLPIQSQVSLKVFDLIGRELVTLVDAFQLPGFKSVEFEANNYASGVYLYQLRSSNNIITRKLLLYK